MKVLVVEDEAIARMMTQKALEHSGYEVVVACDGLEAVEGLRSNSDIQLVVTDWEMPNMNGVELCRAIRSNNYGRYIYVIMLTSNGNPEQVIEGLNAGADDYVQKPFNPAEIAVRLRAGQRLLTLETAEMAIFAMAKLAESRDPETGAHLERVRSYCKVLATGLAKTERYREVIDDEYVRLIYQTSPLHDIGKVAIPDCVLLKDGRLTDEEFQIMKSHTTHGAMTLEASMKKYPNAHFLRMARDIAMTHHEKWNGTGYPQGLSGEEIPLCGRIVAVADVYDALTSKRVYKEAFTHQITRSILIEDKSSHFDPDVVDVFLEHEQAFLDIRDEFSAAYACAS